PELAGWRPFLHAKMGEHCLDILSKPDRLPPSDKAEFFRRTAEMFRDRKPEGVQVPAGLRVLERGWPAYRLRRQSGRAGRELVRRTRQAGGAAAGRLGRVRSAVNARRPLDPDLALYSAFSHRGVLGDPAAVYHKAREIAPRLRGVWVVRDEEDARLLPPGTEHVLLGSSAYRRVTERATYFVNNVNWPGSLAKRPGSVHIHTHQGTPLKFMGADLLAKPGARHGVDVPQMLRRADRWDYSLVANRHSELVWERAYPCHFTSVRTGSPRNDVLVNAGPEHGRRVRERLGVPEGHTVVLYAPTRRDYRRGGHVDRIDLARLAADLGEDHTLVVRLHPSLATGHARGMGLSELHRRGVVVDATDEPHVEDVMLASDLLITDYSALMFDYALLDRPIVVHADDWGAYAASRGAYFDITADAPGHVSRSYRELAWLLESGAWRDEESARLRSGFRARFGAYDDGRAAERVVRTLMLGEAMPTPDPAVTVPAARAVPAAGRDQLTFS
ncbi:CDP-glycerol glycerophosphotransferase family protein, partial [Streptomyces sp. SID5910]|uniref:CDP-glycerol glycerophosphotransferase family protein n=1 Tax=Streptomyces sp. SID5910 TaxID=2690312 RepID=UPI00136D81A9